MFTQARMLIWGGVHTSEERWAVGGGDVHTREGCRAVGGWGDSVLYKCSPGHIRTLQTIVL